MQQESGTVSSAGPAAGAATPETVATVSKDETELVQRARRGEDAAWQTLVRTHETPVFRLAYLLLGNADEAADVTQDTFVAALRSMDRFDSGRPLRPWLLRIAANTARNRRRSIGRYWAAAKRAVGATESRTPGPDERNSRPGAEQLWRAVRTLEARDQEILYLRFFLDLSLAETGSALGVPVGTVKSRLHRALERLRQVVEREYPWLIEELRDG